MSNYSYKKQAYNLKELHNQRLAHDYTSKSAIGVENYNAIKTAKAKEVEKELKKNSLRAENSVESGKRTGIACFSDERLKWEEKERETFQHRIGPVLERETLKHKKEPELERETPQRNEKFELQQLELKKKNLELEIELEVLKKNLDIEADNTKQKLLKQTKSKSTSCVIL